MEFGQPLTRCVGGARRGGGRRLPPFGIRAVAAYGGHPAPTALQPPPLSLSSAVPPPPPSDAPPGGPPAGASAAIGNAMAFTAAVAFSFKAIFVRMALADGADPLALLSVRMMLAAPFYVVMLLATVRGAGRPTRRDLWLIAGMGVVGFAFSAALDFLGLAFIGAGLERIILYIHPTLVLLLVARMRRRMPSGRALAAVGIAWAGLLVAAGAEIHTGAPSDVLTGIALVLGCAFTYAAYLVVLGSLAPRLGAMRVTASAQIVSAFVLGGWAAGFRREAILAFTPHDWTLVVALAAFGTILPGLLLAGAVSRVGPGRASTLGMIGPVAATLLGHVLLGEPLSLQQIVGGLVVAGGVTLATRG